MIEYTGFSVPESLLPYADENLVMAHNELARVKLERFWEDMPLGTLPRDKNAAEFVDLTPYEDHDRTAAIVLPLPFANGWAPHMALRAALLQNSLAEPTRVIVLPNDMRSYALTGEEKAVVANGDFAPIAEKQLQSLRNLKLETLRFIGYSQGAAIGACALKLAAQTDSFDLGNSGLFEPPNVLGRTPSQLQKEFIKSGKGLDKAVNDSGIPALSEAQKSRGGLDAIRKNLGLLPFVLKTQSATNRAIHKGFTFPRFQVDTAMALEKAKNLNVMLASAEGSLITPVDYMRELAEETDADSNSRLSVRVVEGYGHEMGDNIVVHTMLAKLALKSVRTTS